MQFNTTSQKFQWCSNSVTSYRRWCQGEPLLDIPSGKMCVAMKINPVNPKGRGCLKVFDCKKNLPYLCHRRCSNYGFMQNAAISTENLLAVLLLILEIVHVKHVPLQSSEMQNFFLYLSSN